MKRGDFFGALYFLLYIAIVFFFPLTVKDGTLMWAGIPFSGAFSDLTGLKNFGDTVAANPYISGFLKVGLLATFGEMLKYRGKTGSWNTPSIFPKFIVWGFYGILFTYVFALFAKGAGAMMGTALWPVGVSAPYSQMTWGQRIIFGFTTSLWMNLIFCYPMMLSHEWFNTIITKKRFVGGVEFLEGLNKQIWGSFMLKTILVFWIPAHTVTFCLPPDYRVLMSALLSLALGFILTVKSGPQQAVPVQK